MAIEENTAQPPKSYSASSRLVSWGQVMATKPQIGVEEYLVLPHPDRPEPDYVHGEVVERSLPTPVHAQIQALLVLLFGRLLPRVRVTLMTELRVQIEPNLFRVVDFAVYRDP